MCQGTDFSEFVQPFNARGLEKVYADSQFDCIVTNPPWGLRVGKDADLVINFL